MCRFVVYLGKEEIILGEILNKPKNSLIQQSYQALGGKGINADGFGIGWYDHSIDDTPAIFRSVQPAWNDRNLRHLVSKIRSICFLGHVRASTVGDVSIPNCHPFMFQNFSFVHNGTIKGFEGIRRSLLRSFTDRIFSSILGQTDSEHFFALLMDILFRKGETFTIEEMVDANLEAISRVNALQAEQKSNYFSRLNTVLTDGKKLIAVRYISDLKKKSLPLYYTVSDFMNKENKCIVRQSNDITKRGILIASEPLTNYTEEWTEIPTNHMLTFDDKMEVALRAIE